MLHGGLSRGKNKPALPVLRQAHGKATALQRKASRAWLAKLEQEHALHPDAWRMYVECYEKTTYPPSAEFLVLVIDAYLKGECDRTSLNAAVEQARQHFKPKASLGFAKQNQARARV